MIKEFILTAANVDDFFEGCDYTKGPYTRVIQERWIKKITETLVEDVDLVMSLRRFTDGLWELDRMKITVSDIKDLLANKYEVKDLFKVDPDTDSGYKETWIDGSRCTGHYEVVRHSFSQVIDEFVDLYPDKVKFETKEEWIKDE